MFLKIIAYLTNLSHLRGIPGVSAWVGSRRWARIIARYLTCTRFRKSHDGQGILVCVWAKSVLRLFHMILK